MRFRFLFIGRTRSNYLADGIADFLKRIKAYVPTEVVVVKGMKVTAKDPAAVIAADSKRLLAAVGPEDRFVHLDTNGGELSSLEWAAWMKNQMDQSVKVITFGLGGPLGLDDTVAQRADLRLCLSQMTLTHEMSRLVLLEQVYRALRHNAGHPYHK